ncbi:MAG: N-acetylmuramoyl-L-alanine amidase, partial [Paracoccaceae bacterium]
MRKDKRAGQGVMRAMVLGFMALLVSALASPAQDLSALARFDAAQSSLVDAGGGMEIALALSQPVPWRVRVLD